MRRMILYASLAIMAACNTLSSTNTDEARHLAWCDEIYHQNVGCPQYGQIQVPPQVLAQQKADHLAWCDQIYHQNVGCPLYGQIEIPAEIVAAQEVEHLTWCERINQQNVGCPGFKSE